MDGIGPARRFGSVALAAVGASGLFLGCGGRSMDPAAEVGNGEPLVCEGAIDARGMVLRSDVGSGRLFTSGERLILVESRGRILSIDRCGGDEVELARDLGTVTASVLLEPHVWFLAGGSLSRLALTGEPVETVVTDAPSSNLVTDGARVYFFDGHGTSSAEVWSAGGDPVEASPLGSLAAPAGHQLRLLAGGPAGLYFTYDCDCAPWLSRVLPGETEPSTLEGAGAVGVWGSYSVAVGSDRLYVAANPRSGGAALRRLPFAGGEAEELLDTGSQRTALTANHRDVCWLGGNYQGPTALSCLALFDSRRLTREIDSIDSALTMSLALADDAVYWLRPRGDQDSVYEIFAAATAPGR
jgi:hypothetical protein